MTKSIHDYYWGIPFSELNNFVDPIKVNINIPFSVLEELSNNPGKIHQLGNHIYTKLFDLVPTLKKLGKYPELFPINSLKTITYNTHTAGYDFRINPIDFTNGILKLLNTDYVIPFINLDNPDGMMYFKDYVRAYAKDIKRQSGFPERNAILDELMTNIDDITKFYYKQLDPYIKEKIIPKDMLFYIAYRSLDLFEKTQDPKYLVFAHEYYRYVSDMKTSPYPHKIRLGGRMERLWYDDFRVEYQSKVGLRYKGETDNLLLNDHELLLAWDIMKPGMVERELRDVVAKARANPNVDYAKYEKLFEMKMNYYMNSPYIKYIEGKYGLSGYVGFSYPNEYLIFDKFHNSETINPTKKTILTHGEAVFALPADRFGILRGTKQQVLDARKTDDRIKKINHTINGSFITKIDNVVKGPNLSSKTFDEVIEEEQRRILVKKYN